MFRGIESSNRIELSWLVQELSNFGVFGFLRLLGLGGGWWLGVPPTHVHMHAHAYMCKHAHACMVNMVISCKWPPPLDSGKSWELPLMSYMRACAYMCMHVCVCAHGWGAPSHHPPPPSTHPPPPRGDPWNHSKFNSTWTNQDISILFEDLKSVETPPPMGGCIIWWVGGFDDGWGQVKSLKIWKLLTELR